MVQKQKNLCIYNFENLDFCKTILNQKFPEINFQFIAVQKFKNDVLYYFRKNFRFFDKAVLFVYDLNLLKRPCFWAFVVLWITGKDSYFLDANGRLKKIDYVSLLFNYLPAFFGEIFFIPFLFLKCRKEIKYLQTTKKVNTQKFKLNTNKIAYFRTDHWFGLRAGGSIGHIKGIAESFVKMGWSLFFVSTDRLELIDEAKTPIFVVNPKTFIKYFVELSELEYNLQLIKESRKIILEKKPTLIFQRYSLNNYSGAYLSKEFQIPFILEYNGSFIWMSRHWGNKLWFPKITEKIELLNFQSANLIIVVSQQMKKELISRKIPEGKILVNPNGVDPEKFNPGIDGSQIRRKLGLNNKIVVGFIGTFGKWHGAEVLAKSVKPVVKKNSLVHFLFIGDGPTMLGTKRIIEEDKVDAFVTFTGAVSQDEGPKYLAACDILASPHVANPDGTPFFGSPIKLFEYMAMGKGIVASDLGQIGEILKDHENALLVKPGDVNELVDGILILSKNELLRQRLGKAAREKVVANYTWEKNVARVIDWIESNQK